MNLFSKNSFSSFWEMILFFLFRKNFKLTKTTTTVGRRKSHDVTLADPFVSRDHAEVVALEDGSYEVHDVGAKYPIRVNERIVSSHKLRDGDRIKIGGSILIFKSREPAKTPTVEFLANENMIHET